MKKVLVAMSLVAFAVVGCDDSSSTSAEQNDETVVESSSSSSDKVIEPVEVTSSSSEKAKSSSSNTRSDAKQSSSSEKTGMSSSSVDDASSSSVKPESSENSSSSKVPEPAEGSSSSDKTSVSSSSSADVLSSSSETESSSSSREGKVNCTALLENETGWSWDVPKECRFNPDIDYGTMTDERDGKVYKTVKIGNQVWMAENLNYYDASDLSVKEKSWCFGKKDNGDSTTCDVAGRFYTWAAAIDSVKLANDAENPQECGYGKNCNLPAKVQGVCPPDWHLPTQAEWNTLFLSVGGQYQSTAGKALKSQRGWFIINLSNYFFNGNGTDEFGFCALPVGWEDREGFHDASRFAEFWSSTESTDRDWAYNACVKNYADGAYIDLPTRKDVGTSVRCVKD